MKLPRITVRPDVCTGEPCIRDLRFPVSRLLGLLASGHSPEQILASYRYLEREDVDEALRYAAGLSEDRQLTPAARRLSEGAFERVWDNPEDDEYDPDGR